MSLFSEADIPTWEHLQARLRSLPRGSREQVARHLGITRGRLSYLSHHARMPRHETFLKVLRALPQDIYNTEK